MHIIAFLIFGLIVGAIARLIVPGRDPMGWIGTIVLGVLGSFVGGFLGRALLGHNNETTAGFLGSILGAVILVFIYRAIVSRRSGAIR